MIRSVLIISYKNSVYLSISIVLGSFIGRYFLFFPFPSTARFVKIYLEIDTTGVRVIIWHFKRKLRTTGSTILLIFISEYLVKASGSQ